MAKTEKNQNPSRRRPMHLILHLEYSDQILSLKADKKTSEAFRIGPATLLETNNLFNTASTKTGQRK